MNSLANKLWEMGRASGFKWSGAYSELVAFDFWLQFADHLTEIKVGGQLSRNESPKSLGHFHGKESIDLDIVLDTGVKILYMDVKSHIPTHYELLEGIYDALEMRLGHSNYLIGLDGLFGGNYMTTTVDMVAAKRSGVIVDQLAKAIAKQESTSTFEGGSGTRYLFRISYPVPGVNTLLITESGRDPYEEAFDGRLRVLKYWNKVLMNEASLLMFVRHPWFDREMGGFEDHGATYYRAFARRVFMELVRDTSTDLAPFGVSSNTINAKDISEKISGLVFLEDHGVLKQGDDRYKAWIFTNPNAMNMRIDRSTFEFVHREGARFHVQIEDFAHDTY